jgi:hypothetical protein
MAGRCGGNGAAARSPGRRAAGSLISMASEPVTGEGSVADAHLRQARGYRVDAPEGYLGFVWGVPEAGRPQRPLVLVVSDGETVRFVSLRRVAAVLPFERRIVLGPRQVPPVAIGRVPPARRAA